MPKIEIKYICTGCDEVYLTNKFAEFHNCTKCDEEVCYTCGKIHNGKVYCRDCKPVETNYYDRSVE